MSGGYSIHIGYTNHTLESLAWIKTTTFPFSWGKQMPCKCDPSAPFSEAVSLHLKYRNKYMSLQSEKDDAVLWVLCSPGKTPFQSVLQ